ncbi:hypothetical protein [Microbacterium gorillae]|uniref:hypothetical protein n=1 Tax=Microbacterium gorillae TaxID=1231063 RepID=UPI003D97F350
MSEIKRRTFLNGPGEQLLLTSDPMEYITRFDAFVDASGLPPEKVLATPLSAIPLPVASKGAFGMPERWASADPSFMWHPLMWLPPHLALRYRYRVIDEDHGGTVEDTDIESDAMWAIRVALELVHSGLYNPDDGTWLDVLAYHGLDADNPVDQARVEMWLAGGADITLDQIDLTSIVAVPEDQEWALRAAADLVEVLVPAQWSMIAAGIVETVESQLEANGRSEETLRALLNIMGQVAAQALHDVPADPDTGIDYVDLIGVLTEESQTRGSDPDYLMNTFLEAIAEVAADYLPSLQALSDQQTLALDA